jgi:cyclophilin family peptidyl-prolyl cis-trans isomerase
MPRRGWLVFVVSLVSLVIAAAAVAQDATESVARILLAEDTATFDSFLEHVMLDPQRTPLERNLAARAIGRIGEPDSGLALLRASDDATIDHAVVFEAIGDLWANTPASAYKIDKPPIFLVRLLGAAKKDPAVAARAAAFEALARAFPGDGLREAEEAVSEIESRKIVDKDGVLAMSLLRVAAEQKAGMEFAPPPIVKENESRRKTVLAFGLLNANPDVAYMAAYFAGRAPNLELNLTEPLIAALGNPNAFVRAQALRALGKRKPREAAVRDAAQKMLATGSTQEKIAAAAAVAALLPPDQAFETLKAALKAAGTAQATSLHQAILEQLAELKTPGVADFLWDASKQQTPYARLAGVAAAKAGAHGQVANLNPQDFAENDEDAAFYVELLAAAEQTVKLNWLAKGEGVPERFVRALPVRQRIVMALAEDENGKPRAQAIRDHPEWLTDADPVVRAAAFAAAGATGDVKQLKVLDAAFRKTKLERDPGPAIAALEALGALVDSPNARTAAEFALSEIAREGLTRPSLLVRRKAVEMLYKTTHEMHKRELFGQPANKSSDDYKLLAGYVLRGVRAPLTLKTAKGDVHFVVRRDLAPLTADNFIRLATAGFYDNLSFHRVVPAFVAQGGDPLGNGCGDPGYAIRDELDAQRFVAGALGMASSGRDTAGSQFFFTVVPTPHLDGRYTAFGVADDASLAVLEALTPGDKMLTIRLDSTPAQK